MAPKKRTKNDVSRIRECRKSSQDRAGNRTRGETRRYTRGTGRYPNSNPRRIVSDVSLFRYVKIGWSYIYAHSTNSVKLATMYFGAIFWADSSRGLRSFASALVCWQIMFFIVDSQNCFIQNQQFFNVSSVHVVTTNPAIDGQVQVKANTSPIFG